MRSIQVVNVRWYNATAWYGVNLARILTQSGDPSLVVGLADTLPLQRAKGMGLPVAELPLNSFSPAAMKESFKGIDRLCEEFKPDIVNCHRGESFILWALRKKAHGYRLVRTRGDQRLPMNNCINRYLHRESADAVIATNSAMFRYFSASMKVPPQKLFTIPGGVDTSVFYPMAERRAELRRNLGFAEDDIVFGLVGRLDHVKGHRQALAGLAKALPRNPHLRLFVAGLPSQLTEEDIRGFMREYAVPDSAVYFSGYLASVAEAMNAVDVGLVSSIGSETIARVAFEFMGCGIPVMGADVGVMPDLVPQEFLYPPKNTDFLAQQLCRMAEPALREKLASYQANCLYASNGWTMESFYRCTRDVYQFALQ